MPTLYAVSDLHVAYAENRRLVEELHAPSPTDTPSDRPTTALDPTEDCPSDRPTTALDPTEDWLIVAGDVGEMFADVEWALGLLRSRFAQVIWAPGNHELWTHAKDPVRLRGVERYERLVGMCRDLGVLTPEDDFAVWSGAGGPVAVAPLFLLYDYTFRAPGTVTKEESLAYAYRTGVVCTDEQLLHPDPYPDRESWCRARVAWTEQRLAAIDPALPTVLVSHWPLHRHPTEVLWYPEFAQWCGTELTTDWHLRFRAAAAVYGHLHIPRTTWQDGVRFEEVSLGYPREWGKRAEPPVLLRKVLG